MTPNLTNKPEARFSNVGIVALSNKPSSLELMHEGLSNLIQSGFEPVSFYRVEDSYQRFAAPDELRVAQFAEAIAHPELKLIMGLRGGYGISRLLNQLPFDAAAYSKKVFVGYSDFTLIHQELLRRGRCSIAGPMLCDDWHGPDMSRFALESFVSCLNHQETSIDFETLNVDGEYTGQLWGGNLAMLVHTLGTQFWFEPSQTDDSILFLEDIGEHPYRVERMLFQLLHAGVLQRQNAIVLGDFSGYRLGEHDQGYDLGVAIERIQNEIEVPIIKGLPFGHIRNKASLVVGSQARLTVTNGRAKLTMNYSFD